MNGDKRRRREKKKSHGIYDHRKPSRDEQEAPE